jgi:hypothetical protein
MIFSKNIITTLAVFGLTMPTVSFAQTNVNQTLADSSYIQERIRAHTKSSSLRNSPERLPKSAFMSLGLSSVHEKIRELSDSDREVVRLNNPLSAEGSKAYQTAVKSRSLKTLAKRCKLMSEQEATGDIDVIELTRIGILAEAQEEEDLQQYYLSIKEKLSSTAQNYFEDGMRNHSGGNAISRSTIDMEALALEIPEVVLSMYKRGCEKRKRRNLNSEIFDIDKRIKSITTEETVK